MTFQEIVRKIPYLSVRERKILLKLITDSLADQNPNFDLPNLDEDEADETEPQQTIYQPRDEQDDD